MSALLGQPRHQPERRTRHEHGCGFPWTACRVLEPRVQQRPRYSALSSRVQPHSARLNGAEREPCRHFASRRPWSSIYLQAFRSTTVSLDVVDLSQYQDQRCQAAATECDDGTASKHPSPRHQGSGRPVGGHIRGGTRPWKATPAGTTMPEWSPHPGLGNADQ